MAKRGASQDAREAHGVLIVEDQQVFAELLRRAIDGEDELNVVAIVGTVRDALKSSLELRPRVVVMDYALPDGTGVEAAKQIKSEQPDIDVIMLTGFSSGSVLAEALEAGCSGFVPKEAHYSELIAAVRGVIAGQVRVAPYLLAELVTYLRPHPDVLGGDLTPREIEVLHCLADGRSTDEIASELFLSIHTVRNHIANILSKLQASSRLAAVAIAARNGLIFAH